MTMMKSMMSLRNFTLSSKYNCLSDCLKQHVYLLNNWSCPMWSDISHFLFCFNSCYYLLSFITVVLLYLWSSLKYLTHLSVYLHHIHHSVITYWYHSIMSVESICVHCLCIQDTGFSPTNCASTGVWSSLVPPVCCPLRMRRLETMEILLW